MKKTYRRKKKTKGSKKYGGNQHTRKVKDDICEAKILASTRFMWTYKKKKEKKPRKCQCGRHKFTREMFLYENKINAIICNTT